MKRLFKDSFLVTLGSILRKVSGFVFLVALARFYPVADFGLFNYVLAFVMLGWTLVNLGLERYLSLKVVKKKHNLNKYFNFGIALRGTVAFGVYLLMIAVALLIGLEKRRILGVAIYGLHFFPGLIFITLNNVYLGLQYFKGMFVNYAIVAGFYFLTSIAAYFLKPPMLLVFFVPPLGYLLVVLIDLLIVNKYSLRLQPSLKKIDLQKAVKSIWPYFVFYVFSIFYLRSDIVLLGELKGDQAVAVYSSAFRLIEALLLLPQSVGRVFFPHISKKFLNGKGWFRQFKKALVYLFLVSLPISLGIYLFSPMVIKTFFGPKYVNSISVLRIFSLVNVFFFINSIASSIVIAADKLKNYLPWYFGGLLLNVVGNLLIIPHLSYHSPAWVKLGVEGYFFLINFLFIYLKIREE